MGDDEIEFKEIASGSWIDLLYKLFICWPIRMLEKYRSSKKQEIFNLTLYEIS